MYLWIFSPLQIRAHGPPFLWHIDDNTQRGHFFLDSQNWISRVGHGCGEISSISHPNIHLLCLPPLPTVIMFYAQEVYQYRPIYIHKVPCLLPSTYSWVWLTGNPWSRLKRERRNRLEYLFPDSQITGPLWEVLCKSLSFLNPLNSPWPGTLSRGSDIVTYSR